LQTVESQIAVLPELMTTSRSLLRAVNVQGWVAVELTVRFIETVWRACCPLGTAGVMRIDSGLQGLSPEESDTVVVPSLGSGSGVGDGVAVGAGEETGRWSLPSGQSWRPTQTRRINTASRSRRRRQ
jgi:hypothetical protein